MSSTSVWLGRALCSICLLFLLAGNPVFAADPNKGGQIYRMHCSMCHGENGRKVMPNAPDFSQGEGTFRSDMALLGKHACPSYRGVLQQQDILDVIAHIRTLRR